METAGQDKALSEKARVLADEAEVLQPLKERVRHWREEAKTALDAAKKDYGQAKQAILKLQDNSELLSFFQNKLGWDKSEESESSSEEPGRKPRKLSS